MELLGFTPVSETSGSERQLIFGLMKNTIALTSVLQHVLFSPADVVFLSEVSIPVVDMTKNEPTVFIAVDSVN